MILKNLEIKNIRSYKNMKIGFPPGSTLLMGDIGSGKTSILLAIEFALFGLQPSQRGSSLLRNNEKEAYVKLELEIDNKQVIVERKLKQSGKSISQGDASITIENQRFEGSVTEIKNKVLQLLNYPPEFAKKTNDLYKFTVYTPQEEMKQIILESPDTRLNTLRHVFGIDKYKRIEENLDKIALKIRQEIRIKEIEIRGIDEKRLSLEEKKKNIIFQDNRLKEIELEINRISKEKQEKQDELKGLEEKINKKKTLESEKEKSLFIINNKKEAIEGHEKEISLINQQLEDGKKFSFDEEKYNASKAHIISQEKIKQEANDEYMLIASRIQGRIQRKNEAEALKNKISGLKECPTCLQEVADNYKQNILANADNEIKIMDQQNQEDNKKTDELKEKINTCNKRIEAFKQSISEMEILKIKLETLKEKEQKIHNLNEQKATLDNEIRELTKSLNELITLIKDFDKYTAIFDQKDNELKQILNKEQSSLIKKAEINKEIQFLNTQIKELENHINKLEDLNKSLIYLKELEYWMTNKFLPLILYTEKNVMLKLREEFSKLFSEWFSILVSEALSVRLDETFSPIVQQQDYEIDYNFLSGGERTAVALAYRLALNQVINSLLSKIKTRDIVILDEPTDGFSDSQLDKIRDVLQELKIKQLILVSHEPKIEGFVDNIIRLKKREGTSCLESS